MPYPRNYYLPFLLLLLLISGAVQAIASPPSNILLRDTTSRVAIGSPQLREDTTSLLLEGVTVTSPQRSTNSRINTPSGNTLLEVEDLRAFSFQTINDFSALSPNVWIPAHGSQRSTPIYIRGIGSRNGNPSTSVYLNGSPIIYPANLQLKFPNLGSAEILRGPQGTLYGRNSLAGVIRLETLSPFDPHTQTSSLSTSSHGLWEVKSAFPVLKKERIAISTFVQYNKQRGFHRNSFRKEWADPLEEFNAGLELAWKISSRDYLRFSSAAGSLQQGAFPYRLFDPEKKEVHSVAFNGVSSFQRNNFLATLGYLHRGNQYSLDLTASLELLKEKTDMDQDYSPLDIFQMQMDSKGRATTAEALFKWHDTSNQHKLSIGASFFIDHNRTSNPIQFGKDGIATMLQPMLDKVSSNPKLPFNLSATSTEGEPIALFYQKPRHGEALYAQYTYDDLLTKGLSLTVGMHLGVESYAMDYNVASQFHFLATPKQPHPSMEPLPLSPEVNLVGNVRNRELHFSPRVAIGYSFSPHITTYVAYSRGYRAGNYNEQAFADYLMQYEAKALMLALQGKKLPPQAVDEALILYKPERGDNFEWGTRGSTLENRLQWTTSLFYTHIRELQVTDFVASGLGRIQENYSKGRYLGAEIGLQYQPTKLLSLHLSYGYLSPQLIAEGKQYTIPYVPRHTLSGVLLFSPRFNPKRFFFEELTMGIFCNAAGSIQWRIDGGTTEPFGATLDAQLALRRGIFSIWAKGYNLTSNARTLFSFYSLNRTLVQLARPVHFEIGISFSH